MGSSEAADFAKAEIVGEDENDVGLRGGTCRASEPRDREAKNK